MATVTLPPQLTSFVGRTNDLVEIAALLTEPACRLLTLVGPGGIGKTRLAIQAVTEAQSHFEEGVCFVALQPVSSTDFLVPALADALHLTFYGQESPRSQLFHYLRSKELLLVLDNFEHLLDDVALLTEILEAAPRIKLLVTSRETLNVREEWVREVVAMQVPDNEQALDLEGYEAAQLFVERARQARGDFMEDRERPHVIRICGLVGGLPLAIELAAARVRSMSCAQIVEEIQRSMGFLSTALRNVPERHRDMYAVFGPSWDRLTPPQREVFMRLSVFRGGFEREAAEQVAGASLQLLTALVDKSLLRVTSTGRYEMHELVRQYAEARLLEEPPDENERAHDRHCTYYADFLQQREPDLHGADLLRALAEIRPEIDNIRVMWRWAVEHGRWDAVAGCLDNLGFVYQNRAAWREGADAFGSAVDALGGEPSILLGRLLMWQGHMICATDHGEEAHQRLNKAVTILGDIGLYHADPLSYQHLMCYCNQPADIEQMERLFLSALAEYRARGDSWHVANMLVWLQGPAEKTNDFERSEVYGSEALALYREVGNLWGTSSALHGLHGVAILQGRYEEARRFAQECRTCCEAIDDQPGVAIALFREAQACYALREYKTAKHLFEQSLKIINERLQGLDPTGLLWIDVLAATDCRLGNSDQARTILQAALSIRRRRRLGPEVTARTLSITARWLAGIGQPARAVEVLAASLPLLAHWVLVRTEAEELLADLKANLSPDEFAAARARGEAYDLDTLAATILEELETWEEASFPAGDRPYRPGQPLADPLSERELQVLQLVAEGLSNHEIARELVVTVGTVKKHLNNIFSKLHVASRIQAIVQARELDLLS
jgi:predicted ATPase/DNA-binding CsgD family transcriptional regulator